MRNKKFVTVLAAGAAMAVLSVTAHAMTISIEQPDGSLKYYRCTDIEGEEVGTAQEIDQAEADQVEVIIKQEEDRIEMVAEESAEADSVWSKEEREANEREAEALLKIGIDQNRWGNWTWQGKEIYILLDENGGIYQNGSEEAQKEKLYVFVDRDEEGNPLKAEVLDGKELLREMALKDLKKETK